MALLTRKINFYSGNARRIAISLQQSHRNKTTTPLNLGISFVPQQVSRFAKEFCAIEDDCFEIHNFLRFQEAWVVERMGRFSRILSPGLNFLIPIIDQVKYVQSLKEIAIGKCLLTCFNISNDINQHKNFQTFPNNRQSHLIT